jgi:uncharacterized membrane protein YidH (DUF202 family)
MYNFATNGVPRHEHPAVVETSPTPAPKHSNNVGMFIWIFVLIVVVAAAIYWYRKKKQQLP